MEARVVDLIHEKVRVLEETFQTIESATQDHVLIKLKKSDVGALKDAFTCCICKGLYSGCNDNTYIYVHSAIYSLITWKQFH